MKFVFCSKANSHKYLASADVIHVKPVMGDEESFIFDTHASGIGHVAAEQIAQQEFEHYLRLSTFETILGRIKVAKKGMDPAGFKALNALENSLIEEFNLFDLI